MSFDILDSDFNDFLSNKNQSTFSADEAGTEQIKLISPKGDIHYKEQRVSDGLSILEGRYRMDDDVTITGKGYESILEIQINCSDHDIYYRNRQHEEQKTMARSAQVAFLAAEDNQAKIFLKKDISYSTFDIHLPVSSISRFYGESKTLDQFLNNIQRDLTSTLSAASIGLNPAIRSTIYDMQHCKFEGLSKRIYLESKIFELFAFLYDSSAVLSPAQILSARDYTRMQHVATLIATHLDHPLTILQLAQEVGINQTKMKNDFKIAYGTTVFGYLQDLRMQEAKRYLLDTQLSIQEISMRLGYQNMSNFSIAFKKSIGCSPNKLRGR